MKFSIVHWLSKRKGQVSPKHVGLKIGYLPMAATVLGLLGSGFFKKRRVFFNPAPFLTNVVFASRKTLLSILLNFVKSIRGKKNHL